MIVFSGYVLLIIFGIIVVPMIIVAMAHLFHAFRFGTASMASIVSSGIYLAGLVVIAVVTINLLRDVPWHDGFSLEIPLDQWLPGR